MSDLFGCLFRVSLCVLSSAYSHDNGGYCCSLFVLFCRSTCFFLSVRVCVFWCFTFCLFHASSCVLPSDYSYADAYYYPFCFSYFLCIPFLFSVFVVCALLWFVSCLFNVSLRALSSDYSYDNNGSYYPSFVYVPMFCFLCLLCVIGVLFFLFYHLLFSVVVVRVIWFVSLVGSCSFVCALFCLSLLWRFLCFFLFVSPFLM